MTEQTTPTYELQRWNWTTEQWDHHATYTGDRGEGNAYFGVQIQRSARTGPIRLLRDGEPVIADDPSTYYDDED